MHCVCSRKMKRERSELFRVKGSPKKIRKQNLPTHVQNDETRKGIAKCLANFLPPPARFGKSSNVGKRGRGKKGKIQGVVSFPPSLFIGVEGCVMVHSIHFRHVSAKEKSRSGDSFSLSVLASI